MSVVSYSEKTHTPVFTVRNILTHPNCPKLAKTRAYETVRTVRTGGYFMRIRPRTLTHKCAKRQTEEHSLELVGGEKKQKKTNVTGSISLSSPDDFSEGKKMFSCYTHKKKKIN